MRINELVGKQIINLRDGRSFGKVKKADIVLEASTGKVESIILQRDRLEKEFILIPWYAIKQVGSRVIIVDLDHE